MADASVRAMTPLQRWIYRTLLQASFFCTETRPYLPDDDDQLWIHAGCESRTQWEANKAVVKALFRLRKKIKGVEVIGQKRVVRDWQDLEKKRRKLVAQGRTGGLAKAKRKPSQSLAVIETEIVRETETESQDDDPMSLKSKIIAASRKILTIPIYRGDNSWTIISDLNDVYGVDKIIEAFESWAESVKGGSVRYPLSAFVKVADSMLAGEMLVKATPDASKLIGDMVFLSQGKVTFDNKQSVAITRWLQEEAYSAEEILSAFRTFYEQIEGDDFLTKGGARNFVEKGQQLLALARRNKLALAQQERLMMQMREEGKKEADKRIASLAEEPVEEVEETLG